MKIYQNYLQSKLEQYGKCVVTIIKDLIILILSKFKNPISNYIILSKFSNRRGKETIDSERFETGHKIELLGTENPEEKVFRRRRFPTIFFVFSQRTIPKGFRS